MERQHRRRSLSGKRRLTINGGSSNSSGSAGVTGGRLDNSREQEASTTTTSGATTTKSYVWVRTDVVEAIWSNHGTLPKGWKPKPRRGRTDEEWGWTRAYIVQSSSSSSSSNSSPALSSSAAASLSYRLMKKSSEARTYGQQQHRNAAAAASLLVTLTVEDEEFAPPQLRGATVSLSYNPNNTDTVCSANGWWMQQQKNMMVSPPPHDLTSLTHLHEPAVVYCLQRRYQQRSIYTYTGKVLLALNPFQPLEGVYGEDIMKKYTIQVRDKSTSPQPPHVYALAEEAYRAMMDQGDNQSILVSGESGSGKTVTVKVIMSFLANQSRRSLQSSSARSNNNGECMMGHHHSSTLDYGVSSEGNGIESKILSSNPILESFGNARTVRNDNSSRFGKFLQLCFTPSAGALVSASVETYLLEKVRIVTQASGERNYHIFYEILAGLSQEERRALRISNETPQDFRMTATSGTFHRRDGVDDRESFKGLQQAFHTMDVSSNEQREIFTVICALLHLSNVTFKPKEHGEECEVEPSQSLDDALYLLGVSYDGVTSAFCTHAIEARGEIFHKRLTVAQAHKAREAFVKAAYEALFKFIVALVNNPISSCTDSDIPIHELPRIGILDIFGFECFESNSFEQLCINYCNEALQQQFNRFMFKLEQQEYDEEGIDWSFIEFPDNEDVLDLIENRRDGIFEILDENCKLSSCTDSSFLRAVIGRCEKHDRFESSQIQRANQAFTIEHYLGPVTYSSQNFLEKNRDDLPKQATELMLSSSRAFMTNLVELLVVRERHNAGMATIAGMQDSRDNKRGGASSSSMHRETVSSQFRIQLHKLRLRIDSTTPHFIRCLKPNEDLKPNLFDPCMIADQLRCAGVLEAIRVSRIGFPHRFYHEQFLGRYGILAKRQFQDDSGRKPCASLIASLIPLVLADMTHSGKKDETISTSFVSQGMQVGLCRVFLRARIFRVLEQLRDEKLTKSVIVIQKETRRLLTVFRFRETIQAVYILQCFARKSKIERQMRLRRRHAAACKIQSSWRQFLAETELMAAKLIALFCQAYRRGAIARRLYLGSIFEKRVFCIQRWWRQWVAIRKYRSTLQSLIRIQCFLRCVAAREIYRERKRAVRTLEFISEDRNRYKEEATRLREEVEKLRSLNSPSLHDMSYDSSNDEVARLRAEVLRLQNMIALDRRPPKVRTPPSPPPIPLHPDDWSGKHIVEQIDWSPPAAVSLSDAASSPNISLLDTERDIEAMMISRDVSNRVILLDDGSMMVSDAHPKIQNDLVPVIGRQLSQVCEEEGRDHRMQKMPSEDADKQLEQLHMSILTKDHDLTTDIANRCLDPLALVNHPNLEGKTALHVAAECDNLDAATLSIEMGAIPNVQDHQGNTALLLAKGEEMVEMLLSKGSANPNIPNIDGKCAIHSHVERLDIGAVRLLLKSGAKVNVADHTNWFTPLHLAVSSAYDTLNENSRLSMVDLLCNDEWELDLNDQDCLGNTALHYAVQEVTPDAADMIGILLKSGADPNLANQRNQEPLLLLCHNNELRKTGVFETCLQTLLHHGANTAAQSSSGCTPLHLCLYHYDIDSAVLLIHHSADLNLVWKKPASWESHWEDHGSSDVLPLDMVSDEQSLYRIIAAIQSPPVGRVPTTRPWCMHCQSILNGATATVNHCGHCGRHLCTACMRGRRLSPHRYSASSSSSHSRICLTCNEVLVTVAASSNAS